VWLLSAFVYLPVLYLLVRHYRQAGVILRERKELWGYLALLAWALVTQAWPMSNLDMPVTMVKREFLSLLLILGWALWGRFNAWGVQLMIILWGALAGLYSAAALITYPLRNIDRIYGFGGFMDNPNPAAYSIACLMLVGLTWWPRSGRARALWAVMHLCSLAFVVLSGSRGAMLALIAAAFVYVLAGGKKSHWLTALIGLGCAGLVLWFDPSLLARGDSERLELLRQAVGFINFHPWVGIGISGDYRMDMPGQDLEHCHNFVLDTAIRYGLIATSLWLIMWGWVGVQAYRLRKHTLGMAALLFWVFACVALQFDVFALFGRNRAMWLAVWMPVILVMCVPRPTKSTDAA
jgi:O-antigen ligase